MTVVLLLFAIATVAGAGVLVIRLRRRGPRASPTWLVVGNFGLALVTLVLAVLTVAGV